MSKTHGVWQFNSRLLFGTCTLGYVNLLKNAKLDAFASWILDKFTHFSCKAAVQKKSVLTFVDILESLIHTSMVPHFKRRRE